VISMSIVSRSSSVYEHISKTRSPNFAKFSSNVASGRGSVAGPLTTQCNTLRASTSDNG